MDQNEQPGHLRFDSFELDPGTGELSKNGRPLRLQDQPAKLLVLLAERAGKLVTREEIQEALWGEDQFVEFDHAINTAVKKIRTALDDDAEHPRLLETLPRKGYRFIGSVEHVSLNALAGTGPSAEPVAMEQTGDPSLTPMDSVEAETALLSTGVARALFVVIQVGYLSLYCSTLYYIERLGEVFSTFEVTVPDQILSLIMVTAMCGIAVRFVPCVVGGIGTSSRWPAISAALSSPTLPRWSLGRVPTTGGAAYRVWSGASGCGRVGLSALFSADSDPEHLLHSSLRGCVFVPSFSPMRSFDGFLDETESVGILGQRPDLRSVQAGWGGGYSSIGQNCTVRSAAG